MTYTTYLSPWYNPFVNISRTPEDTTRVFVYGSLKRGGQLHKYLKGYKRVEANAQANGYALLDLGSFPGMVFCDSKEHSVLGEIYSVPTSVLSTLDYVENTRSGLYTRMWDEQLDAWVYIYKSNKMFPVNNLMQLSSHVTTWDTPIEFNTDTSMWVWNLNKATDTSGFTNSTALQ